MGSLFDGIGAEETVVRESVEELVSRVAELMVRVGAGREGRSRLVITRETVLARMVSGDPGETVRETPSTAKAVSPFAGAGRVVFRVRAAEARTAADLEEQWSAEKTGSEMFYGLTPKKGEGSKGAAT
ncbi:hypothetical protein HNR23_004469 [Nocardiopsis mwathae]|uniref:Uncharacterized protein n=1 Tax=Nocardiopsis mwathae TaxID=1472723 RepID=A0A7X0D8V4_9ACTN|nr:hypothetical protein [Nocardiopsis mwathae]MBB6174409.1 hypothetical protein [Nocardiopsis mwathae]